VFLSIWICKSRLIRSLPKVLVGAKLPQGEGDGVQTASEVPKRQEIKIQKKARCSQHLDVCTGICAGLTRLKRVIQERWWGGDSLCRGYFYPRSS